MQLKKIIKHRKAKGMLVKVMAHPATVIIAKDEGMDFLFYDCEHGILAYEQLHDVMVLGNTMDLPSIVRVPQLSRADVSRTLDYGAKGIMVPMIETREQAEQLVMWSKYPPIGKRSYSGGANTHYSAGGNHAVHMQKQNEKNMTIVQIESVTGVANINEILCVEGIDAVIVGPCDLGISMGNPDNVMDELELSYIAKVANACKTYHKAFGIIGGMNLLEYFKDDVDILISAIDLNVIRSGIQKAIKDYEIIEKGII